MSGRKKEKPGGRRWRRLVLAAGCAAGVVGGVCWYRAAWMPRAHAVTPAARTSPQVVAPAAQAESDWGNRPVAYLFGNQAVSREELGNYLIARFGADRLPPLVNRRIIEHACRELGVEVTAGEVEAALADDLKSLAVDQATFVRTVLAKYNKNLYEWREDVLRPKLLLTKFCRRGVHVSEMEVRQAFEATYGEKIECRMILWRKGEEGEKQALEAYARIRDSEEEFDKEAKKQYLSGLAGTGGRIKPFGRHTMGDEAMEQAAFKLQPGEISTVTMTKEGPLVLRCERRIPADPTATLEAKRSELIRQVIETRVQEDMKTRFKVECQKAHPRLLRLDPDRPPASVEPGADEIKPEEAGPPGPGQVVATFYDIPITREELGEYLIARRGADYVDMLINHKLIDKACAERGITVSDKEVEDDLASDLKKFNVTREVFVKEVLSKHRKSLYEWKEDVVRPRLMLTKLCRDRVKVTEEEVKKAFEAHYGEKVECRMILWPPEQAKFAMAEYARIRDSEEEFRKKATSQASSQLAAKGGQLPPLGRYTLGDPTMEREAFRLQPGEVSTMIGTPQGNVVLKCDARIPADTSVKLESVRPQLIEELRARNTQIEMQTVMQELRTAAGPRSMLRNPNQPEDITEEYKREMASTPDGPASGAPAAH